MVLSSGMTWIWHHRTAVEAQQRLVSVRIFYKTGSLIPLRMKLSGMAVQFSRQAEVVNMRIISQQYRPTATASQFMKVLP